MSDHDRGQCFNALTSGGLLIDPTVAQTRSAIQEAFTRASHDEATLFVAFIGHGEFVGDDYYLLPTNAAYPPRSDTAVHIDQVVKELLNTGGKPDGFAVLLDTCHSGVAVKGAAKKWVAALSDPSRLSS